ncbi:MAG: transposase [Patescibacteria group bacterium]|nr:transposase [Patescibacteria group bacterium]
MPTPRVNKENESFPHFVTITTIEWLDIFTKKEYFEIMIDCLKYCRDKLGLLLYEYVFMTNHIHLIIQSKEGYKLSQIISSFKQFTSKRILDELEKDHRKYILKIIENSFSKKEGTQIQIWQRENYPEVLETEKFMDQKIDYIYNNPVKKGYVEKPEDWTYSSARNKFLDDNSVITLDDF